MSPLLTQFNISILLYIINIINYNTDIVLANGCIIVVYIHNVMHIMLQYISECVLVCVCVCVCVCMCVCVCVCVFGALT